MLCILSIEILQVASETSGEFKDLLVALVTGSRDSSRNTNDQEAKDVC